MSGRWLARMIGIIMLLVFLILLMNLQRRLIEIQRTHRPAPASTP